MTFYELVSSFAARNAVEGLVADGGGAVFSIDGTEVALREDAAGGAVVATAGIFEMPPDEKGAFAALALRANFAAAGATALSLDPETGELAVSVALPLAVADPESLSDAVAALVDAAETWRRNAIAFLDVDEESAVEEADGADADPLSGDPFFLRV